MKTNNSKNSSDVHGVLAVIALVLLAGGAYFMRINDKEVMENKNIVTTIENTESISTSDWKTYKNSDLGYEVKYPEDWRIYQNNGDPDTSVSIDNPKYISKDTDDLFEFITIDKSVSMCESTDWNNTGNPIYIKKVCLPNGYFIFLSAASTKGKTIEETIVSTFKFTSTPDPLQYETPTSEIRRIKVTSPKGGEVYRSGQKVVISWNDYHGPDADTYTIMLLGEKPAQVISNDFIRSSGLDGLSSIEWTVPNDLNGKYRIEVYKPGSRELVGRSNEFTIQQ